MRIDLARIVVLFAFALACSGARASVTYQTLERVDGQQRWSAPKRYASPADVPAARYFTRAAAAPAEEVRVFISGTITRDDKLAAEVMTTMVETGRQKLSENVVWFASDGGDIDAAMDIGRLLRRLRAFTIIDRNSQCMSACVFAFMGGERRAVAGRLGIHRPFFPYTNDRPDRLQQFRHMQRVLKDYVDELDFPASLYEAVMLAPPESIRILAPAELKSFYLDGISPSSEDLADSAAARYLNLSMADYLKRKASAPACNILVGSVGCAARAQGASPGG